MPQCQSPHTLPHHDHIKLQLAQDLHRPHSCILASGNSSYRVPEGVSVQALLNGPCFPESALETDCDGVSFIVYTQCQYPPTAQAQALSIQKFTNRTCCAGRANGRFRLSTAIALQANVERTCALPVLLSMLPPIPRDGVLTASENGFLLS